MAEFLKPEINFDTHCGDQPTFGRLSTMYDYPTKGITQASSYPKEACLLYTSPSPRDQRGSRMPSSA